MIVADYRSVRTLHKSQLQCMDMQVYLKAGFPQLRRSGFLQILQSWLQRVGMTTDFQYMMLSAMFLPQQSVSLVCDTPALHLVQTVTSLSCTFEERSQCFKHMHTCCCCSKWISNVFACPDVVWRA